MTREQKLEIEHAEVSVAMTKAEEFERMLWTRYNCWRSFEWVRYHLAESGWQGGAPITLKGRYRSALLIPLLVAHEVTIISSAEQFPVHLLTALDRFGERPEVGRVYLRFLTAENTDPRALLQGHAETLYKHSEIIAWQRETFPMRSLNDIHREQHS